MFLLSILAAPILASGAAWGEEPTHNFDLTHVSWRLAFDEQARTISGDVTNVVELVDEETNEIALDCGKLNIERVTVDGKTAKFKLRGEKLTVMLPDPAEAGQSLRIRTLYTGKPLNGFFFVDAASAYPAKTGMVYTQSEPDDTRNWLPTYDHPDDYATSEAFIEVPKSYTALSNGKLVGIEDGEDGRIFHWKMDQPHATYLNSLVAGEYVEVKQKSKDTSVSYLVPPGLEAEGQATFARTPEMISFVAQLLGQPYPFEKFSQAVVGDFVVAGMENASAVTLTIHTLHPASAEPIESSDDLLVHEISHQWIGNVVAGKTWDHLWINEGFATLIPLYWLKATKGQDEYDLQRYSTFAAAVGAFRSMPANIVTEPGPKAITSTLGSPYTGGAARLAMLADSVGDKKFWRAVGDFIDKHRGQPVSTEELFEFLSAKLDRDLTEFMDQWFYSGSIPRISVSRTSEELVVKQREPYFEVDLPVWFLKGDKWIKRTIHLDEEEARFPLEELGDAPMIVDPEFRVLSMLDLQDEIEPTQIVALYGHATSASMKARILDLWFGKLDEESALGLLKQETMPLLAARMIARLRPSDRAAEELALMLKAPDKRVALSAANALGKMPAIEKSIDALAIAVATDSNVVVRQAALGSLLEITGSKELALRAWDQESYADTYRIRAMSFWARHLPDVARERALEALSKPISEPLRSICIEALGIVKDKPDERRVFETLSRMLQLPAYRSRVSAIRALGVYGDPSVIPAIRSLSEQRYLAPAVEATLAQLRRGKGLGSNQE